MFFNSIGFTHRVVCKRIKELDSGDWYFNAGLYVLAFPMTLVRILPTALAVNASVLAGMLNLQPGTLGRIVAFVFKFVPKRVQERIKGDCQAIVTGCEHRETKDRWNKARAEAR